MRKYYYVTTFLIIMIVSYIGVTYSFSYGDDNIVFELVGPSTLYIDVNSQYEEYGVRVFYNNMDMSSSVTIDDSLVDIHKLGEYLVKYSVNNAGNEEYIYRRVIVIDKSAPEIELISSNEVSILLNSKYYEYGYRVTDNYDKDLDDKVKVTGNVDTSKEGTYELTYSVSDNSGNTSSVVRKVIVKEPEITLSSSMTGTVSSNLSNVSRYSNTIIKNEFNNDGVYIEGYVRENSNFYKIKLKNRDNGYEYLYNMTLTKDNYYSGKMDLTFITNGIYDVYLVGKNEERLLNKLDIFSRVLRARVGNKLVTFNYDNDKVSIIIDDFKYEYDFLIDPGHGGSDTGASNGLLNEKDLNLKVSMYEKCRYESMGYKVYMIRYDDSYGEMFGDKSLDNLDRRALAMGYYGAVSKISYSNHHNASGNSNAHGFEILVGNKLDEKDLIIEKSLYNKLKKYYGISDGNARIYSRNYYSGSIYNKINGTIYSDTDYYALIRIPYELYNVKNIIYEPIYMSNTNDFNFYVMQNKWMDVSEMKIEEYVNYLGGTYNNDNSKCLV